jgi:adenosylhomocysteine nucleosidase
LNVVGIVAALEAEARILDSAHSRPGELRTLPDGTLLAVSGVGLAPAERAARALIGAGASALASWGMAGGLDPALRAGTIFLPSHVLSVDGKQFPTARQWRERLGVALAAQHPIASGKLFTSAHMIVSIADKALAFSTTGALAVDMESAAIAAIAARHELPFIAVRVIVDTADDALPRAVVSATRSGRLRLWWLIASLARAPAEIAALLRIARRYRVATRSLLAVARAGSLAKSAFPALTNPGAS